MQSTLSAIWHRVVGSQAVTVWIQAITVLMVIGTGSASAQLAPEIGYLYPSGATAGSTVDILIGGYDWTPDTQIFVHDPRVKLEIVGPASGVLVPEPPYWFGFKARGYAWPLPREFKARLTVPPDVAPGLIKWQVANANGASPVGSIQIGSVPEIVEDAARKAAQQLPPLPIIVSGQIRRIEEIDRYQFQIPQSGPVTIQTLARQIGSPLHMMLQVRDGSGRVVVDAADSEGRDLTATFVAQANVNYEVRVHDLDFAGDRSYVYQLHFHPGPNVLAAYPAAGKRGQTQAVEFVGVGLATGADKVESVIRDVAFPADPGTEEFSYVVETPSGKARPFLLGVSDIDQLTRNASSNTSITAPFAITGSLSERFGSDSFMIAMKKGDVWQIEAEARRIGSPLDLELAVIGPDGKPSATSDDMVGTTDADLLFTAPADGNYQIIVSDRSGKSGQRTANYHLTVMPPRENVVFSAPAFLPIPLGSSAKLVVKAVRTAGHKSAIPIKIDGLPAGVTTSTELIIPENKSELSIDLVCSADAPANAGLCHITATPQIGSQTVSREVGRVLLATTMKPRIKLTPEGLDDVRKVHRGSTYLAPILIERLDGFSGPITLEMTSKQQRHRQGLSSDEFVIPPDAARVEYPIFIPEWMETTKTSRMIVNGSVQVADPKGNVRTLLQRQELRIGILPEGALMKLSHTVGDVRSTLGTEVVIPLTLSRTAEFRVPVKIELIPDVELPGAIVAEAIIMNEDQANGKMILRLANDPRLIGERAVILRATGMNDGRWPVVSETTVLLNTKPAN